MYYIYKTTDNQTVGFAADELKKYLRMMMPEDGASTISYDPSAASGFRLGLMRDFGLDTSDSDNTELDDVIYIDCDTKGGIIAGSNYRSVLLAVYEYFRQMGCRWLFPGVDGEYIPMKDITPVRYRHKASSRIRGNCLEGYISQNIVRDFIDFMPKVGLNTFMIQFKVPGVLYNRFYTHSHNETNRTSEPVSREQITQWTAECECELERRGIMLHSYGHGFTIDPFGIDSANGWAKVDGSKYSDEVMQNYAMIDGKRKFYRDQPMNTQICMTNETARARIVDYVVSYAKKHSSIDYLHIWLADDSNNHCECEKCRKHLPSDLYVKLMNEVDDALTAAGLDTRIVVIVYVDTFWAPIKEKLNSNGRFVLLVAPIMRDYTQSFDPSIPLPSLRPYERNRLKFPESFEENVAYYNEWKKNFDGEHFVFEYHFWKHQHFDVSGRMLARRIYDDVKAYRALGESGIIQCGSQRSFFPNGYAFYTHARSLFDSSLTLEEIENDYHTHAYGDAADKIIDILESLSEALPYEYVSPMHVDRREGGYRIPEAQNYFIKAREVRNDLLGIISENYNFTNRIQTVSIRVLEHFCTYIDKYVTIFENLANGDKTATNEAMAEFRSTLGGLEPYIESYFDHGQACEILDYRILRQYNK